MIVRIEGVLLIGAPVERRLAAEDDRSETSVKNLVLIMGAVLFFCTSAVAIGLSLPTNHDEFQYIAAAHLYGKLNIYRDFFYSQTPYFPVALHYWNKLLSDLVGSVYVSSRLFNVFWSLLYIATFMYALVRASPSAMLSIGVFAILYSSEALDLPLRVVRNDMMPLALTSSALALMFQRYFSSERNHVRWELSHFLAGILLAAAVSSKHSYAAVAAALTVASLFSPGFPIRESRNRATLPLVIGGLVGAAPLAYYVATNWNTIRFSLIEFHQTAHIQWYAREAAREFSASEHAVDLARKLLNIPFLASLVVFAIFILSAMTVRPGKWKTALPHWGMLFLSMVAIAFVMPLLLLARPLHPQYLAPLIPFVGVCIVSAGGILNETVNWNSARLPSRFVYAGAGIFLVAAALFHGLVKPEKGAIAHLRSMMVSAPKETQAVAHVNSTMINSITYHRRNFPEVWAAEHFNRVARRLADILDEKGDTLRIATLMSPYPIEAGYEIYAEFAGAPFFYRSSDHLSPKERLRYVGVSPLTVRGWLEEVKAEALLVGYNAEMESGFWDYARDHHFACFRVNLSGAYNLHSAGSREAFLLVLASRTDAPQDCTVHQFRVEVVR